VTAARNVSVFWLLVLGALGTDLQGQPARPAGFVGFQEFLGGVAVADANIYLTAPASRVRTSADFEEMRRHILTMYEGVSPVHSFMLDEQYFDCIPIEQQPCVHRLGIKPELTAPAPPPDLAGGEHQAGSETLALSPLQLGLNDEFGNSVACDDGTIPMRRITLNEMTHFETLQQFFQKEPGGGSLPSDRGTAEPVHKYAVGYQNVANIGGSSTLNVWNPVVNTIAGEVFSLSQVWYVAGKDATLQTAESGWQVYPSKYGTTNAVLFTFYTAANYKDQHCYNTECGAFCQVAKDVALGAGFSNYSTTGGVQWEVRLKWALSGGKWWLYFTGGRGTEAIGYYDVSVYKKGPMSHGSDLIEYGGEVTGTTSWPQMGSGAFADAGWQKAAFQRLVSYITPPQRITRASLKALPDTQSCIPSA
jgi:hypothetical protein